MLPLFSGIWRKKLSNKPQELPDTLSEFTTELMEDLRDLRAGKITPRDARVRALLAREVLRSVHLQLEGMKYMSETAKQIEPPKS